MNFFKTGDFKGTELPFSVDEMLVNSIEFITVYWQYILLVLGFLFLPVFNGIMVRLTSEAAKPNQVNTKGKKGGGGKKQGASTAKKKPEKTPAEKAATDEVILYQRKIYDHLTKRGQIKERDQWFAKVGDPYKRTLSTVKARK